VGQPIAASDEHMLSGIRAEIALKIYGEDLDVLPPCRTGAGGLLSVQA